jgi:hypothetical protein
MNTCCPPPRRFRPAGQVKYTKLSYTPPDFLRRGLSRGARRAGERYEELAQEHFQSVYDGRYIRSPWLRFTRQNNPVPAWCQPDAIHLDTRRGLLTIVEFKLRHTSNAWYQTRKLYQPVLEYIFPKDLWNYAVLEVVRWFDPHTSFPEDFRLIRDPFTIRPGEFGVHIWTGKN